MTLKVGIAGGERGKHFYEAFAQNSNVEVISVMDPNKDVLNEFQKIYHVDYAVRDFNELLKTDIDIVVVASPMQFHVEQAVQALEKDIHVLSEVTAAVSIEECKKLLRAVKRSNGKYMMGENYCYIPENICINNMVKAGLFGEIYYGEGEYLHDVRNLHYDQNNNETWRKKMQVDKFGVTYGTHSLGPVLQWFDEDIESVLCLGSGESRYQGYVNDDTSTMLCKTQNGSLIRVRLDLLSSRPHHMRYYTIQGTKGVYEAYRSDKDIHRVWLEDYSNDSEEWLSLAEFYDEFLPFDINDIPDDHHWGADFLMVQDFINSILEDKPVSIDVYRALNITLPGILSEESILNNGKLISMPDLNKW